MSKENRDKETEGEEFARNTAFMMMGIVLGTLLSVVGSMIAGYLGIFSRDQLLENPLGHSIGVAVIVFFFITVLFIAVNIAYMLLGVRRKEDIPKTSTFLLSSLKKGWKWYIPSIIFFCPLIFWYLYHNATSVVL